MTEKKTALVTGSTAGIGRAVALTLAKLGHHVIINGRRAADEASGLVSELKSISGGCIYVSGDIAREETRKEIIEALRKEGGLDVLVNNAGRTTSGRKDILALDEKDILDVFQVNLIGPMLLSSALVPLMKERSGRSYIINIASISSYTVSTNRADYCISKAGMSMMTQLYAARLAMDNIGVFEVRPGIISTDMTVPVREKYDRLIAEGLLPMPRWGQPEDVAKAVESIVLGYFPYSTGEIINVDGGFHIRRL
ncbi:MAG TPA: 3-ketoacyl-ACP reductase [Desulfomonilia bacterium]|jgi:3-oxoacyl-[acyl-carrier protein] reductase